MNVRVPLCILNTLVHWFGILSSCVRRAGVLSQKFSMRSGTIREGSVISPLLFSLYIKDLIIVLRAQGYGCIYKHVTYSALVNIVNNISPSES